MLQLEIILLTLRGNMKVKFWGTRGSLPTTLSVGDMTFCLESGTYQQNRDYGGDTTCVQIYDDEGGFFVDAGSGITKFPFASKKEYHILLSHLHWDHIHGLNFFVPIFLPGFKLHIYGVHPDIEASIKNLFNGINFPVLYEQLGATIEFHQLQLYDTQTIDTFQVTPFLLDHPGKAYGYCVEKGGKRVSTAFDTECIRTNEKELGQDHAYYQNLDLLVFDAQYKLREVVSDKMNWGHASPSFGVDLALRENIKNVVMFHHDPNVSYRELAQRAAEVQRYYEVQRRALIKYLESDDVPEVNIHYAYKQLEIEI